MDSDDYIIADVIESLYNEIYDCDCVSCGYTHVDNKSNQENIFHQKKIVLTGKDVLYKHDSIDNTIDYLEEKFGMIIYLYIKKFVQRIDCHGRVFINW